MNEFVENAEKRKRVQKQEANPEGKVIQDCDFRIGTFDCECGADVGKGVTRVCERESPSSQA